MKAIFPTIFDDFGGALDVSCDNLSCANRSKVVGTTGSCHRFPLLTYTLRDRPRHLANLTIIYRLPIYGRHRSRWKLFPIGIIISGSGITSIPVEVGISPFRGYFGGYTGSRLPSSEKTCLQLGLLTIAKHEHRNKQIALRRKKAQEVKKCLVTTYWSS